MVETTNENQTISARKQKLLDGLCLMVAIENCKILKYLDNSGRFVK